MTTKNETKVIKVTIGEMIDNGGNCYQYKGGDTANGRCYKNMDAWKSGKGVIYMSEEEINEVEEFGLGNYSEVLWTKDSWINYVGDVLGYEKYGWDFCKHIAELILNESDWQCLSTLLNEYELYGTIDAEYEEWLKNNKKD